MTFLDDLHAALDRLTVVHGRLVVAVSGGADSTALLHALARGCPGLELICAHVNHELRGDESEQDAANVEQHARSLGIPFRLVRSRPDPEVIARRGIEAAARVTRYQALQHIRKDARAGWIATGHTMDDQAETVLQKLITSTAPESLCGILPITPEGVVRPLLDIRRETVHTWVHDQRIAHRFDSSNDDLRFLRNRIRHVLLPKLEEKDEQIVPRLALIADHVRTIQTALAPVRRRLAVKWIRGPHRSRLWSADLPEERSLRRMILLDEIHRLVPDGREVSSARLETLPEELHSSRRISLGDGLEATLDNESLILERRRHESSPHFSYTLRCGETIEIAEIGASVTIRRIDSGAPLTDGKRHFQVFSLPDKSPRVFVVRNRRPGDRIRPLGMQSEKKLKDLLIDRKISREDRDAIPILVHENEIVWVAGVEVADQFRVMPGRDLFEVRIDYENATGRSHEKGHHGRSDSSAASDSGQGDS